MSSPFYSAPNLVNEAIHYAKRRSLVLFIVIVTITTIQAILVFIYPNVFIYSVGVLIVSILMCGYFGLRALYTIPLVYASHTIKKILNVTDNEDEGFHRLYFETFVDAEAIDEILFGHVDNNNHAIPVDIYPSSHPINSLNGMGYLCFKIILPNKHYYLMILPKHREETLSFIHNKYIMSDS
jgi:hypothetical protein